jgi:hypothetical protein
VAQEFMTRLGHSFGSTSNLSGFSVPQLRCTSGRALTGLMS